MLFARPQYICFENWYFFAYKHLVLCQALILKEPR